MIVCTALMFFAFFHGLHFFKSKKYPGGDFPQTKSHEIHRLRWRLIERIEMFNRKIQVDLVKRQNTSQTTPKNEVQSIGFEKKAKIVSDILSKVATKVVIGVCAYVVLDTFRKSVVESAKN